MVIRSKHILIGTLVSFSLLSQAQWASSKQWQNWRTHNKVGIDLSTDPPTAIVDTVGARNAWRNGVMCDSLTGDLLMYTNGDTIWNRMNQPMPNGTGLLSGSNAHQCIVPYPGEPDQYIVIHAIDGLFGDGCWYSVVDMTADGGLGDVDTTRKNVLLNDSVNFSVAIAPHSNGRDYWSILRNETTNDYHVHLIDDNGPDPNAVVYSRGSAQTWVNYSGWSEMNHDNTRLLTLHRDIRRIEIFPFDASTGTIGNVEIGIPLPETAIGAEFSPDGFKLYVTYLLLPPSSGARPLLEQYDLSSGDSTLIQQSRVVLDSANISSGTGYFGPVLVQSGKILFHRGNVADEIAAITNPDMPGVACGYVPDYVGDVTRTSFPNIYWSTSMLSTSIPDFVPAGSESGLYPNPSNGQVYLRKNPTIGKLLRVEVFNAQGHLVLSQSGTDLTHPFAIDCGAFASGRYFIRQHGTGSVITESLIVN